MNMLSKKGINEKSTDELIKRTLRKLDKHNKLDSAARKAGIHGGADALRVIMNSPRSLSVIDRCMMVLHIVIAENVLSE